MHLKFIFYICVFIYRLFKFGHVLYFIFQNYNFLCVHIFRLIYGRFTLYFRIFVGCRFSYVCNTICLLYETKGQK